MAPASGLQGYANLLTNNHTGGSGVIDPRMPKLLPAMMTNMQLNSSGDILSHGWARDIGVDMLYSDMRRFNYSTGNIGSLGVVYRDFKRPYEFTATNIMTGANPTDLTYWFRRFNHSTHESNYNNEQLMKSNPLAMKDAIWSDPVWWDKE